MIIVLRPGTGEKEVKHVEQLVLVFLLHISALEYTELLLQQ